MHELFLTCKSEDLCNQFGLDQDRRNFGPDLFQNSLTLIVFLKEFFFKFSIKLTMKNYLACKELDNDIA